MRRITPIGFLILLLFVFAGSGIAGLTSFISNIWQVSKEIVKWIFQIAFAFPDELDLVDAAYTWVLYLILCFLCFASGIYLSKKQKNKVLSTISFSVSAISLLLTIFGTSPSR